MRVCVGGGEVLYDTWESSIFLLKNFEYFGKILERDDIK